MKQLNEFLNKKWLLLICLMGITAIMACFGVGLFLNEETLGNSYLFAILIISFFAWLICSTIVTSICYICDKKTEVAKKKLEKDFDSAKVLYDAYIKIFTK